MSAEGSSNPSIHLPICQSSCLSSYRTVNLLAIELSISSSLYLSVSISLSHGLSLCLSLSIYLSVCLSVCLSVGRFVRLSVCLFVCLSLCLFVCLSVCQSVSLSVCQSVSLSVCQSVSRSVGQSVSLSVCQSVSLSVCQSVSLSVCLVCQCICVPPYLSFYRPIVLSVRGKNTSLCMKLSVLFIAGVYYIFAPLVRKLAFANTRTKSHNTATLARRVARRSRTSRRTRIARSKLKVHRAYYFETSTIALSCKPRTRSGALGLHQDCRRLGGRLRIPYKRIHGWDYPTTFVPPLEPLRTCSWEPDPP